MHALGLLLGAAALGYALTACLAVRRARNVAPSAPVAGHPAVTVLKPLCGAEPGLAEALRSLCAQDYPPLQIVFGVQDPADPALEVVQALRAEYPNRDIAVVIDATRHGFSAKVSNLINMMRVARHDWLVLADADVHVPPGYITGVCAPLADPTVGIVTCPYRGRPAHTRGWAGLCSRLGALFVNDWFMPSVRVAALFGSRDFAFGATIALRRAALDGFGGFAAIADQLADDYRIGELTRRQGLRTVLSHVIVDTGIDERSLRQLAQHETRWLRTIRAVRPAGYAAAGVTFSLPVALLGYLLAAGAPAAWGLLLATAVARVVLHFAAGDPQPAEAAAWRGLWLLPVSDLLGFLLWCWGFAAREVQWRQSRYRVARDGSARPIT
ncbi:MAG: bacteriohopanetetrol glucosamine biosynthesis glycosyltransferase HpnI [Pseudomonadota bacterium]|jgi:ceramide glucosyltransferase|nr:bacteriohopanetetrol glucosamine biosynthesis glycosyltransferase HpnI [Pseudomonadota bacterium]